MKKKVLCLHGYSMNDAWMAEWIRPLEALTDKLEFIIPCAPVVAPEDEVRAMCQQFNMPLPEERIGEGKNWCWYRASLEKPPVYQNIEQSLTVLADIFKENAPIEGVLGWSQGTVMTAILAALSTKDHDPRFQFNWAVMCGGFRPGDIRFKHYFDSPLALPSLHVIGVRESLFMREQGERLAKSFTDAEILVTPAGHMMPVKYPEYMQKISCWLDHASDK